MAGARHLPLGLLLAGPRRVVERELARHADAISLDITIIDAPDVIGMAEAPARRSAQAARSIRLAAEAVADGRAVAMFSAGSTGASVMALCGFGLLPGVIGRRLRRPSRPAAPRCCSMPVRMSCRAQPPAIRGHGHCLRARGAGRATTARGPPLHRSRGEQGHGRHSRAHQLLKGGSLNFIGNVEGRDDILGMADVIVCDGFTGNVALKISEGLVDTVERFSRTSCRAPARMG